MKSRDQHPPGSWQILIPEIGMKKPETGSFTHCVNFVMGVVRGNKFLAEKHGWSTTREWAEAYVENQNVARCQAHGWTGFLILDGEPVPLPEREIPEGDDVKKNHSGGVAGAGKQLAAGVRILLDWLGSGGKPVDLTLAEKRASICATCPQNNGGDWRKLFTQPIADKIRKQVELKNEMKLVTGQDKALTVCQACACPLQLKVWTPLEHVSKHTDEPTRAKLDPRCWITAEERQNQKQTSA